MVLWEAPRPRNRFYMAWRKTIGRQERNTYKMWRFGFFFFVMARWAAARERCFGVFGKRGMCNIYIVWSNREKRQRWLVDQEFKWDGEKLNDLVVGKIWKRRLRCYWFGRVYIKWSRNSRSKASVWRKLTCAISSTFLFKSILYSSFEDELNLELL